MAPTEPVLKTYRRTDAEVVYYDDIMDLVQQMKKAALEKRYDLNREQRRSLKKVKK